jgi:hypothetical protein
VEQKAKIEQLRHDLHEARSENSELRAQHHRMADRLYRLSDPVQDARNDDEPHGPPPNQGSAGKRPIDPVQAELADLQRRLFRLEERAPW